MYSMSKHEISHCTVDLSTEAVSNENVSDLDISVNNRAITGCVKVVHSKRHFIRYVQLPRPVHLHVMHNAISDKAAFIET